MQHTGKVELTILMPCLNEARTVGDCITSAKDFLLRTGIAGEILIADNGSTDGSQAIAVAAGARVVEVVERGYGSALIGGIDAAQGRNVIIGDADKSYDFEELDSFVRALEGGASLVIGDRFAGGIDGGAMPALHRYLGTPVISFIGRLFYRLKIQDFNCGLRGFSRDAILQLGLNTKGMEFASEMIIKAALAGIRIEEVPTRLRNDGRDRAPHLNSWRDGWRHLRFLLTLCPRWLYLIPGLTLWMFGTITCLTLAFRPISLGVVVFDIHTMLYAGGASIVGLQMIYLALFVKTLGVSLGLFKSDPGLEKFLKVFTLEKVLIGSGIVGLCGLSLAISSLGLWKEADFSSMDPAQLMRLAIPAVVLTVEAAESAMAAFFIFAISTMRGTNQEQS